ncbi:STAS domain-containing protein [Streptacidiphilus cavernicola]|uniref:Anti-sigma factor antagonist n=1 Tax=Streptacidiphilus cavernicola TaxID=3342716 RepID=A0ABV6VR80_9ACTN
MTGDAVHAGPRFGVDARREAQAEVFTLAGELDHDTAPMLRKRFDEAFELVETAKAAGRERPDLVVVDCAELAFCDSTGLNVLLTARLRAEELGIEIRLAALRGHVARMFEITGVGGVFSIHSDLADALAAG